MEDSDVALAGDDGFCTHSSQTSVWKKENSGGRKSSSISEHLFSEYEKSLSVEQRDQYYSKLRLKNPRIDLPDPYKIVGWVNNMKEWPGLNNSHIHQYLLPRQGPWKENEVTACASLKGYNAFKLGNVQAVEYTAISMDYPVCFLRAVVVSPCQAGIDACLAWVCLEKTEGTIKASHCTCLKQFEGVCSHIAGLVFKVEAAVALGMNKEDSDRSSSSSSSKLTMKNKCGRSRLCVARVKDTYFTHQNSNKGLRRPLKDLKLQPLSKSDQEKALEELRKIVPNALVFQKDESDTDTASEDEGEREEPSPLVHHPHTTSEGERKQLSRDEKEHLIVGEKEQLSPSLHHHSLTASDDEVNSVVSTLDFEGFDSDDVETGLRAMASQHNSDNNADGGGG